MLKRFLCGAALLTMLCGSVSTPTQAEEVYVRNRLFKDAFVVGNKTYLPVDTFLRAIDMPWTYENGRLVIGRGDSPEWTATGETFLATREGNDLSLTGIVRGDRIYVPAKELAEFVDYKVIYNADTGIVDVVQGRLTSDMDEQAAKEVADANKAEVEARNAAWQARVDKARAERKAKEEAQQASDESAQDGNEEDVLAAKGDPETDPSDTKTQKIDGKDDRADASYEDESDGDGMNGDAEDEGPPPEANLVVLSTNADPNNYTGEVKFRAVLQNQGYAQATDVKARLVVVGPDGKEWIAKTIYHGPMAPDDRWEITEDYKHRLGAAIPRGNYDVRVSPTFKSAAPK